LKGDFFVRSFEVCQTIERRKYSVKTTKPSPNPNSSEIAHLLFANNKDFKVNSS